MKRPFIGLFIGIAVFFILQNPDWTQTMLIDRITELAKKVGAPTDVPCKTNRSRACGILEQIEVLALIDYPAKNHPLLGERFRIVAERVPA